MTKETEVTAAEPVAQASRDEEVVDTEQATEVVETVELEPPEEAPKDIEDVIADTDDPRSEIYARHNVKRETEIAESQEVDAELGYIPEGNDESALENSEATDIIEGDDDTTPPPENEEMVEIKVYGDVRQVPKSKVDKAGGVAEYQKQVAVQEGMSRNADQAAQNQARTEALDARERRVAAQEAAVPAMDQQQASPTDPPTGDQNLEEMARQYQEAVYDGDENAPSILAKMVAAASNTGEKFDQNAFRQQVKDELIEDDRKSKIVTATHALIDKHPELNQRDTAFDPRTFTAVDDETEVVTRQHPDWEPEAIVQEAFDRIQKWKGKPQKTTMSDKQGAKRAMNRPKSGTQRYTQPPPAPAKTSSDYVAEQRRLRGQEA